MLENGLEYCNCPRRYCVRYGDCGACIEYHSRSLAKPIPRCMRGKEAYFRQLVKEKYTRAGASDGQRK